MNGGEANPLISLTSISSSLNENMFSAHVTGLRGSN